MKQKAMATALFCHENTELTKFPIQASSNM